eukprot:Pompholyxophrys_punicea_v1_NODE_35_length_4890_cov_6.632101.p4 type:complete len:111 gc:universal NODE_35_length_4890_cov_6.632101:4067-3735(-)
MIIVAINMPHIIYTSIGLFLIKLLTLSFISAMPIYIYYMIYIKIYSSLRIIFSITLALFFCKILNMDVPPLFLSMLSSISCSGIIIFSLSFPNISFFSSICTPCIVLYRL